MGLSRLTSEVGTTLLALLTLGSKDGLHVEEALECEGDQAVCGLCEKALSQGLMVTEGWSQYACHLPLLPTPTATHAGQVSSTKWWLLSCLPFTPLVAEVSLSN